MWMYDGGSMCSSSISDASYWTVDRQDSDRGRPDQQQRRRSRSALEKAGWEPEVAGAGAWEWRRVAVAGWRPERREGGNAGRHGETASVRSATAARGNGDGLG